MIGGALPAIPDVVEHITAVRAWASAGPRLLSVNGAMWQPGQPLHAICKTDPDDWWCSDMEDDHPCPGPPGAHGTFRADWIAPGATGVSTRPVCGIYGFKDLAYGLRQYRQHLDRLLWGEVWLWGRVWPSTDGYRAEYARPASLYEGRNELHRARVARLADIYEVPVVPFPLSDAEVKKATGRSVSAQTAAVVTGIARVAGRLANG